MTFLMNSGTVLIAFSKKYIDINSPPVAKQKSDEFCGEYSHIIHAVD
jgi:hypothetical protein